MNMRPRSRNVSDDRERYDLLNHVLSGNVDKRWRRIVAARVREKISSSSSRVLDVACGTGDLSLTLFEMTGAEVVGSDFCRPMLEIAARKIPRQIPLVEGDALDLPFRDGSFDVTTIAFGLRNLRAWKAVWRNCEGF
jgi:demethylmenaquinone methyltransferase/2-methoxy-6-polyprenyl-1,4-benzoquinol methylase